MTEEQTGVRRITLGQMAYEAHRPLAYDTCNNDDWDKIDQRDREAWEAAAKAVADYVSACAVLDAKPEPEPAKVIVVTEMPIGDRAPVERRYRANSWDLTSEGDVWQLDVGHRDSGKPHHPELDDACASYAPGAWLSVREEGALVPDGTARKLGIALAALNQIPAEIGANAEVSLRRIAELVVAALADIADVDL